MSNIGKNIKKIRGIKNLNQNDFATLFNLKRASIGAYEEGRAEPKLATIIEIANYFSISIDDLVQKELSVNDFYKFDLFREDLLRNSKHNLNPTVLPVDIISIPFVSIANTTAFCVDPDKKETFQSISLPLSKGRNYFAFEVNDNNMFSQNSGVLKGDILILKENGLKTINSLQYGYCYVFMTKDTLLFRQLNKVNESSLTLHSWNLNYYNEELKAADVKQIFEIEKVISNQISRPSSNEQRIMMIEAELTKTRKML